MSVLQAIDFRNGKLHFRQLAGVRHASLAKALSSARIASSASSQSIADAPIWPATVVRFKNHRVITLQQLWYMYANLKCECFVCASQVPRERLTRRSLPSPRLEAHCLHVFIKLPSPTPLFQSSFHFLCVSSRFVQQSCLRSCPIHDPVRTAVVVHQNQAPSRPPR